MKKHYQIVIMLIICGIAQTCFAQNNTGRITGKVIDKSSGNAIVGATVIVNSTSSGAVTDVEGNYLIDKVPGGIYSLSFKYLGYQTKVVTDVTVKNDGITSLNVVLDEPSSQKLNEVVITSSYSQESISSLLSQQKNSSSVSSGIAIEQIRRSPDRNTGEVLKRVSGTSIQDNKYVIVRGLNDRYNDASLNDVPLPSSEPDRKTFAFDIIPANLIDNIVINKTASPDKPGDFAGGLVQIHTKDFPDKQFLNISIGGSYNTISTFKDGKAGMRGNMDYLGFDNGLRKLPSQAPSGQSAFNQLSGTAQDAMNKAFKNTWVVNNKRSFPGTNLQLSYGNIYLLSEEKKLGFVVSVTHNHMELVRKSLRNDFNIQSDEYSHHYLDTSGLYSSNLGAIANVAYSFGKNKISFKNLYNHIFDNQTTSRYLSTTPHPPFSYLTQSAFHSLTERSLLSSTLEGEHTFGKRQAKLEWDLNYSLVQRQDPDIRITNYTNGHAIVDQPVNGGTSRSFSNVKDNIYNGGAGFSLPFSSAAGKQILKIGTMEQFRFRHSSYRPLSYHRNPDFSYDNLTLPPQLLFVPKNLGSQGLYLRDDSSPSGIYDADAELYAGYLMSDNHLTRQLRIIWGIRYERYSQRLKPVTKTGSVYETDTTYNSWLPSVNMVYALNDKTNIRLSYANTVARPEFREIASFSFYDFIDAASVFGNPGLKQTNITNADIRYEYYPRSGEVFSIAGFYKYFKDPISEAWASVDNNDRTYINLSDASCYGAELELRKSLGFIPGSWSNNSFLFLNASYIFSAIRNPNQTVRNINGTKRPLPGQSPYLINAGLQFADNKNSWNATILYNRTGQRIDIVGDDNSNKLDIYEKARDLLDLQISRKLFDHAGELKLNIANLLNNKYTLYQNRDGSKTYSSKKDYLFYQYALGTTFSLSFSYSFY